MSPSDTSCTHTASSVDGCERWPASGFIMPEPQLDHMASCRPVPYMGHHPTCTLGMNISVLYSDMKAACEMSVH